MESDFEEYKLDYKIHVTGELNPYITAFACCDIIVDDGRIYEEDEEGYVIEPTPRYGCVAIGPTSQIDTKGRFSTFYWIHLLGSDPNMVPIPESVTLHVHISPGVWRAQSVIITPSMVQSHTNKEMCLDIGKISWICTE